MELRKYQQEAAAKAIQAIYNEDHAALQLATGTGKSLIIAEVVRHFSQLKRRVWVLSHIQQIIQQNANTYKKYANTDYGIICAGMSRKDLFHCATFATIQSISNCLIEPPDLIIIDEAHRVPHNSEGKTLYQSLFERFPNALRMAFTATPWRMDNGRIYGEGEEFFFNKLIYKYSVLDAVRDGFLSPLIGVETTIQLNTEALKVTGNDFTQSQVEEAQSDSWLKSVAKSVADLTQNRNLLAVYCPTVKVAQKTAELMQKSTGRNAAVLHGGLSQRERSELFNQLNTKKITLLASVDMLTTGFDYPALDCIVCLRPTLSSSLWVQIQGRGTRLHPSKKNALILDYAGNLIRLGGVGMYESFFKELSGDKKFQAIAQKPYVRKERFTHPGVTSLRPIDPMTGDIAKDKARLTINNIHKVNSVPITTRRGDTLLLVQYTCSTVENARINATLFVNTQDPKPTDYDFFQRRQLAVSLPSDPKSISYMIKSCQYPSELTVQKRGKYWSVLEECF